MNLRDNVKNKVGQSIFITGSARSGTTILGKIIHSMKHVEYTFEPPALIPLFARINKLDDQNWRLFFEAYLYEDFFVNALAGRNLNFNTNDDSCIYNVKSKQEIEERLTLAMRKHDVQSMEEKGIITFKLPNMVPFLAQFDQYYPEIKKIILVRNPVDTINSLLRKEWYNIDVLNKQNRTWPVIFYNNQNIPFWVDEEDYGLWLDLDEINRCAYCYLKMSEARDIHNAYIIKYDELIESPSATINRLAKDLNLEFGELTRELINGIKKSDIMRDDKILEKLVPELHDQILKSAYL